MRGYLAGAALLLPFTTWLTLGESPTVWDTGFIGTPLWGLVIIGLLLVALGLVWPWNRVIGGFCAYAAASVLWSSPYAISVAVWIVLGGVIASQLSALGASPLRLALVTLGMIQAAMLFAQALGYRFHVGMWGELPFPHGTYGNPRYLGMALAIIAPLAPVVLLPIFIVALVLTKSYIAILAAGVALGVRFRRFWPVTVPASLATLLAAYHLRGLSWNTLESRLFIGQATLADWWQGSTAVHLVGHGLGAWLQRVYTRDFHGEMYLAPYNDYLQLLHELGLVGLGFLALFATWHWRWFVDEPALLAVAILAVVWFPFHLASVAVVALAVVGRASCLTSEPTGSTVPSGARSYSRLWWEVAI